MDRQGGKWAKQIIGLQHEDGSWGYYHSLSQPTKAQPMTTEQALRRLRVLGFTAEDEPVHRALQYTEKCFSSELSVPDRAEKQPDWPLFLRTMFAANIRLFVPEHELAAEAAGQWAEVVERAFMGGAFDQGLYDKAYMEVLRSKGNKVHYFKSFVNFYPIVLLSGTLSPETERRMLDYVLKYQGGIYYIGYNRSISKVPFEFASLEASRFIAMLELLSRYDTAREKLGFAVDWINDNKDEDGQWDMGAKANDGVYFPVSDSWKKAEDRKADCTNRIKALLNRIGA